MAKVNHRDTLDSQLRELQRRLRLLEARHTPPAAAAQFVPSRTGDWWQLTNTPAWTELATATVPGSPASLRLRADGTGDVLVQIDGQPDAQYEAGDQLLPLPREAAGRAVRISARIASGTLRVYATLERA